MYFVVNAGHKAEIERSEARQALASVDMGKRPDFYPNKSVDAYLDEIESEKYGDFNVSVTGNIYWSSDKYFDSTYS